MQLVLAILAVALMACSSSGGKIGKQPSWRTSGQSEAKELGPIVFAPSRPAVSAYNSSERPPVRHSELADAISVAASEVAARLDKPIPTIDSRLSAAAAELATIAPPDAQLAYPLIEFALQRYGIIEPSPHIIVIWGERNQKPSEVVDSLRERLPEILEPPTVPHTRLGVGEAKRGDDESCIVVAFQSSYIDTAPIPRSVPGGGMVTVDGLVKGPYSDPQVFVTRENGAVERPRVTRDQRSGGFKASMACGRHRGRQQVEITAIDASGSTVLANFPVWCGSKPPTRIVHRASIDETEPISTEQEGVQRMLELLNVDRKKHGLPPLSLDSRLSEVARKHSLEMKTTGRVAHVSPVTGSAADRVDRAGIRTSVVLENVARAYGVAQAQSGLMNSPGHRSNILAREASDVGIGVVFGQEMGGHRELFITQVFAKLPKNMSMAAARDVVRKAVTRARTGLEEDPALSKIAGAFATSVAAGEDTAAAGARASAKLRQSRSSYVSVSTLVTAAADIDAFDPASGMDEKGLSHYGVGVARGPHPDMGDNAFYIVLLLAVR